MRRFIRSCFFGSVSLILTGVSFADAEKVRIATYNLDNYLVMDRHVGASWRPAYPKPENEKLIVRQVIHEVDPDILVLQEMGTVDFLEELRADLANEGQHYNYAIHMAGVDPDRHLAVLSKLPPKGVVKHKGLDFKYFDGRKVVKRGMLEATFELEDGIGFTLFAVHLKSRYEERKDDKLSASRRTREAEASRNRIIERTHEQGRLHYLVAGDYNDHPNSATMRRFYNRGKLKIGSLVPATDSRGEVWTYYYEKEARYELVDGFVASPKLLPHVKTGSGHVADFAGVMTASDHRMVYIDLQKNHTAVAAGPHE